MDKSYVLSHNHITTAIRLLEAREAHLTKEGDSGLERAVEIKRVGGLLRTIRRAERDMIYWFEPDLIKQDKLPFSLEKDYYDDADVPQAHRYLK